jgi:hypothetical protein
VNKRIKRQIFQISALIFVLAVLVISYILKNTFDKKLKIKENRKVFGNINERNIVSIGVIRGGGKFEETLLLTNVEGKWKVILPVNDEINEEKLKTLIDNLTSLEKVEVLTNLTDYSQYGLEKPLVKLSLAFTDREKKEIELGERTVDKNFVYTKLPEKNEIFLVNISNVEILFEDFNVFREKEIFKIPIDSVEKVELKKQKKKFVIIFRIENNKKNWYLQKGKEYKLLPDFNEKLVDIYSILINSFVMEKAGANFKSYYEIKLISKDKTNSLYISSEISAGKWICRSDEKEGLFLVDKSELKKIFEFED